MSKTNAENKGSLRKGFSTGTAATAAARAALRFLLTGRSSEAVAVRLPGGYYLPVPVREVCREENDVLAVVIKDGGDDPDVTHKAEIRARVRRISLDGKECDNGISSGIRLMGGEGVGVVTKPGLPVQIGEPAINPVPREMLSLNLAEEYLQWKMEDTVPGGIACGADTPSGPHVLLTFSQDSEKLKGFFLEVEIEVPKGAELARHTLNPRLGILGGISILGPTGIVKPFSHTAYEETIQTALSVAQSNGCLEIVLSTGGKSERFAQGILSGLPVESFVQVADFFAFAVREVLKMGFPRLTHSVFFGKVVKMAQGHAYTHAHKAALDLELVAELAAKEGHDAPFCRELAVANTARHALELLLERNAMDVVHAVARKALDQSARLGEDRLDVRLLVFDYGGRLLVDLERKRGK